MSKNATIHQELPDVLIQDSKNSTSYFISSEDLQTFKVSNSQDLTENTMTFVIPDENYLDEVEFNQTSQDPSVLIKFSRGNSQYLLNSAELEKYKVKSFEDMSRLTDQCITFIIPTGNEFLEDIPNMSPAMLQSVTEITELPKPIEKLV